MTNAQMITQVKNELGYPAVDVELTSAQISKTIAKAIMVAKDHINVRKFKTYQISKTIDNIIPTFTYKVDLHDLDFETIIEVYRGDMLTPYLYDTFYLSNYARPGVAQNMAVMINERSNLDALMNRSWRLIDKTLYLDKFYNAVTIEYIPKVIGLADIEDSWWQAWILRYATAASKGILARIRGQFEVDSNPFKTDAANLATESREEITALMEEIKDKGLLDIRR